MAKRFKLSDDSLNTYGFRVLTSGIDLASFQSNPIMLWNHARGYRESVEDILPIGYWDNIAVENGALYADAVFSSDPFAQRIATMVEEGTLRACSIGLRVVETSEDPSVLLQGQKYATVTKCKIRECSIVDIPSNQNAIALYDEAGVFLKLSDGSDGIPSLPAISKDNILTMKKVLKTLKLADTVSEDVAVEQIEKLQEEYLALEKELRQLKDAQKLERQATVKNLLDTAITEKRIAETERTAYEKLFDADFEAAKTVLAARTATIFKLSDVPNTTGNDDGIVRFNNMTFSELSRKSPDTLATLKDKNFDLFKKLYKSEYGNEYKS